MLNDKNPFLNDDDYELVASSSSPIVPPLPQSVLQPTASKPFQFIQPLLPITTTTTSQASAVKQSQNNISGEFKQQSDQMQQLQATSKLHASPARPPRPPAPPSRPPPPKVSSALASTASTTDAAIVPFVADFSSMEGATVKAKSAFDDLENTMRMALGSSTLSGGGGTTTVGGSDANQAAAAGGQSMFVMSTGFGGALHQYQHTSTSPSTVQQSFVLGLVLQTKSVIFLSLLHLFCSQI